MSLLDTITLDDQEELREAGRRVVAARLFATPEEWPLGRYLPVVKWSREGEPVDAGVLVLREDGRSESVIRVPGDAPIPYSDFEAMADDGWRAD